MVLCAGAFGCYAAQGSLPGAQGQGYDLNLSYSRTTLKAVADAITQQVGIAFSYETALAGYPMENLEVSEKGATIEAILAAVFTPRGIDYRVVDKVVVLTRSTRPVPAASAAAKSEVKGVVRDAAGNPMIGVTVTIKGTLVGVSTGVDGDLRFVDVDGDGIMTKGNRTLSNHGDLEIIGNQSPRYQYSINMSLNWNGIGLSMLWQGVGKRDWYPWTESGFFWGKWNRAYNSLMKTQTGDNVVRIDKSTDNWRVTNMDKNPYWTRMVSLAANRNDGPLTWENDHYLQDASYIRLKNITIDYTFPKHICKKLRLEGLKVYLSGENLFTHSPMFKHTDMFDPEVITSGDSDFAASTTSGLNGTGNGYSYPMLKTVTLGINVTF